ncbi:MAG: acetyltransferase [Methanoregula sp.]|jgi:hypothetical protein
MPEPVPVILVHGWKSHPGIWNRLVPRLDKEKIPYWSFDHTALAGATMEVIATALGDYITVQRRERGYDGPVDIVCHSIGSCATRYFLEVMDGSARRENVRQIIAIGPPNNGSSIAELFCDPVIGPGITQRLVGTFVPRNFEPVTDVIVQACRPESPTLKALQKAGTRSDIAYRIICAENRSKNPGFFPCFDEKTCELLPEGGWQMTYAGDGIVPVRESVLPGATLSILPSDPGLLAKNPKQYCHIFLPRAPETVESVIGYLKNGPDQ